MSLDDMMDDEPATPPAEVDAHAEPPAAPAETEAAAEEALAAFAAASDPQPAVPSPAAPRRSGRGGKRQGAGRPRKHAAATPAAPSEPPAPSVSPELQLKALEKIAGAAWRLIAPMLKRRALTEAEAHELAEALQLIEQKYGPDWLDKWMPEINLTFTVIGLWYATALPKVEPAPATA